MVPCFLGCIRALRCGFRLLVVVRCLVSGGSPAVRARCDFRSFLFALFDARPHAPFLFAGFFECLPQPAAGFGRHRVVGQAGNPLPDHLPVDGPLLTAFAVHEHPSFVVPVGGGGAGRSNVYLVVDQVVAEEPPAAVLDPVVQAAAYCSVILPGGSGFEVKGGNPGVRLYEKLTAEKGHVFGGSVLVADLQADAVDALSVEKGNDATAALLRRGLLFGLRIRSGGFLLGLGSGTGGQEEKTRHERRTEEGNPIFGRRSVGAHS